MGCLLNNRPALLVEGLACKERGFFALGRTGEPGLGWDDGLRVIWTDKQVTVVEAVT